MKLQVDSDKDGILRVSCDGPITQDKLARDSDPMANLFGTGIFARKVVLNLEKSAYIDSPGISWLLICHKHFVQAGGKLVLHSVPQGVMKVLRIVQLPKIIGTAADEAEAVTLAAKG